MPIEPEQPSPRRMEAFSDGVIAVIITIIVLEMKVPGPELSNIEGLRHVFPMLVIYALSFVQIGIYWVNHHYVVDRIDRASHALLWANLGFLFALSLIPFATAWVGERGISSFSVALYAVSCALPAFAWGLFSRAMGAGAGKARAGSRTKQIVSSALYLGAIPMAYYSPAGALLMIAVSTVQWLVPPRR